MEDPPARNAAWRFGKNFFINFSFFSLLILILGFNIPANYDDVGLNCGGLSIQKANGKLFVIIYISNFDKLLIRW